MRDASEAAQDFVANANGCTVQLDKIPKASKAATLGLQALKAAGGMLVGMGISLAVSALVKVLTELAQAKEKARQAAIDSISTYKEEQSSLDEQIKKYIALTKAIESGNLSVEETVEKKEELLGIQNDLINTFGDEAEGIDLVNGKYEEQLSLLKNISKQNAANIVAENKDAFEDAKIALEKERKYNVGQIATWNNSNQTDETKKLLQFVESYSDLFDLKTNMVIGGGTTAHYANLTVKANVEDADKVLHSFAEDLRKFGDENNINVSGILQNVSTQLNKTWTEELTEYKDIYDEYSTALVMSNDKLREKYNDAIKAVEAYNNAIASGEGYEKAKSDLQSLETEVKSLTDGLEDSEEMWHVFQEIFGNKERSREERVFDLKEKFGLHHNDKTLETFFANEDVDIEWFERIAAVSKTAADAIKLYRTEVVAAAEEAPAFAISPEDAKALSEYQSKIDSISSSLADLHNLTSSDITSLMTEFKDNKDAMAIFEKFGVNGKAGVGDLKSALEEIGKLLMETAKDKVPQMSDAIEDMYSVIGNPKGDVKKLASELKELEDVLSKVKNGEVYSDVEVTNLINKYPELADAVQVLTDGYSLEEDALISLLNTRITKSNEAVSYELEDAKAVVEAIQARIQARMAEQRLLQRTGKAAAFLDENGEMVYSGYTSDEEFQNDLKELAIAEEKLEQLNQLVRELFDTGSDKDNTELFDWYATAMERLQHNIDNLGDTVGNVYEPWSERQSALNDQIDETNKLLDVQRKAYTAYQSKADGVGLDTKYESLIKQGYRYGDASKAFSELDSKEDADLIEKIQEFTKWWELYLDTVDAANESQRNLNDYRVQSFTDIQTQYDAVLADFENQASLIEAGLANAEARGQLAVQGFYQQLYANEEMNRAALVAERIALEEALQKTGLTGGEEFDKLQDEIDGVTIAIAESENALLEFENAIRDADWGIFDFNREQAQRVMGESDFLLDLLDAKKLVDEMGEFTDNGLASIGLHGVNYNGYLEESIRYTKELAELEEDLAKAENANNTDLINRRNELLEQSQEMILAAEQEKSAIADLVRESYENMKSSLQDLITEYEKALDAEKD